MVWPMKESDSGIAADVRCGKGDESTSIREGMCVRHPQEQRDSKTHTQMRCVEHPLGNEHSTEDPPSETEGGHPHGVPTKPREIPRFARNDGLGLTTRGGNVRECRLKRQRTDGGEGRFARRPGRRRRGGLPGWWWERGRRIRWRRRR